jgi:hypothetical protein
MSRGRGGELVHSTLYICMELSQWNPLLLLMYDHSKIKFKNNKCLEENISEYFNFPGGR